MSLQAVKNEVKSECIVSDNGSTDNSPKMVKSNFPWVDKLIENRENVGFAKGNNLAKPFVRGKYVLFLNSDTIVYKDTLKKTVEYLGRHKDVGAITCKIQLPNGELDKDARRAFITPWIALSHIYLKLDRIFPKSKLFAKYWYGHIPEDKTHEVDVLQGAFFMVKKKVLDEVEWFDEDYFLDGEDIDLCWKMKEAGWKIVYYPEVKITHIKGSSKGKVESKNKRNIPLKLRLRHRMAGVDSMELFVRKRLWNRYPLPLLLFVILGIRLLKAIRLVRTVILG